MALAIPQEMSSAFVLQPNIWTLCAGTSKTIHSLLSSAFQHLRDIDASSKVHKVRNQIFIKSLELDTLRRCLDQAIVDFADLKKQEKVALHSYAAVRRSLPTLPAEIIVRILSLQFHDSRISLRSIYRGDNKDHKTRDFANILEALESHTCLKHLFLSSTTVVVPADNKNTTKDFRSILAESDPMKFFASLNPVFSPTLGSRFNLMLQSPARWKKIRISSEDLETNMTFLKKCIPVLPHIDSFEFHDYIVNTREELLHNIEKTFPDNIVGGRVARLRSATIRWYYLKPFVSSGFFHAVTNLVLSLTDFGDSQLIRVYLSILPTLRNLSSLTLVEHARARDRDYWWRSDSGFSLQLPSLKTLHLQYFKFVGINTMLNLFRGCVLDEVSLVTGFASRRESSEAASQAISSLHNLFPRLSSLTLDWGLDAFVTLLSKPSRDSASVWYLPALRSLTLSGEVQVDVKQLVAMLHARIATSEVDRMNHIKFWIPSGKPEDERTLGSDMLTLHELEKLVPNVVCMRWK